jgi:hypothetical protein
MVRLNDPVIFFLKVKKEKTGVCHDRRSGIYFLSDAVTRKMNFYFRRRKK